MTDRFRAVVAAILSIITLLASIYAIGKGIAPDSAFFGLGILFGYWFR